MVLALPRTGRSQGLAQTGRPQKTRASPGAMGCGHSAGGEA